MIKNKHTNLLYFRNLNVDTQTKLKGNHVICQLINIHHSDLGVNVVLVVVMEFKLELLLVFQFLRLTKRYLYKNEYNIFLKKKNYKQTIYAN